MLDYPKILDKEILTFYELSALFLVTGYLIKYKNDYRVAEFTYNILLHKDKYYMSTMPNALISFYSFSARYLGKIEEYEKSLNIAKIGIKKAKEYDMYTNLPNLYYYKSLSEKNLGMQRESKKTIVHLFSLLNGLNDSIKLKYISSINLK